MQRALVDISVVVAASALLAWLAVVLRQPLIIAYVTCGLAAGPWGLRLVASSDFLEAVSQFGIILLLFHAGIVLHPRRLKELAWRTASITLGQCLIAGAMIFGAGLLLRLGLGPSLYLSLALMFSSTILVIKLLPTVTLHHQRMGAYAIAILIAQDIMAVSLVMFIGGQGHPLVIFVKGLMLATATLLFEQYVLRRMMMLAERYREILFLLSIGWGLGSAWIGQAIGFSPQVAAFVAGVALARSPLALFISEGLKLFRDFFLVFFFFVLGAQLDLSAMSSWLLAIAILIPVIILGRYLGYFLLFRLNGENRTFSREAGLRLSQASEFALIIALAARQYGRIDDRLLQLIMLTTLLSMIISSYLVVFLLPTPLGITEGMKQD